MLPYLSGETEGERGGGHPDRLGTAPSAGVIDGRMSLLEALLYLKLSEVILSLANSN